MCLLSSLFLLLLPFLVSYLNHLSFSKGGVGCSISCRCEGCKNAFGIKDGELFYLIMLNDVVQCEISHRLERGTKHSL